MNYFDVLLAKKLEDDRDPKVEGLSVTENGRYHEDGVVYDPVIVNVPETPLSKLTVTENGTYTAPTGTAYSEVDVDVPLPSNAYLLKEIEDVEIASFNDGSDLSMPKLEVNIEPVQDLHGYDAPWVGGAGKNKLEVTATSNTVNGITFTVNSDGTIQVKGTATANADLWLHNGYGSSDSFVGVGNYYVNCLGCRSSVQLQVGYATTVYKIIENENDSLIELTNNGISWALLRITSGTVISTPIVIKPMIRLSTVSDSTFAPYSNECPISGWDKVNVGIVGSNLIDITSFTPTYALNGITYTINTDGSVVANGTATGRSQVYWSIPQNIAKTFANKKLSGLKTHEGCSLFLELNEAPYTNYATDTGTGATINSSIENANTTVNFVIRIASGTTVSNYVVIPRITNELQTYTLNLGGTRYGVKVDLVSGVMTVDRAYVDLGTLDYSFSSSINVFYSTITNMKAPSTSADRKNGIISSMFPVSNSTSISASMDDKSMLRDAGAIYIRDTDYNDTTAFKTAMNGVQLVYELATPLTIQLTPTLVKSLKGVNNVSADTGNILDLSYLAKEE